MNQEVKQKWVKALRSGKYLQGYGFLAKNDRFCCLGVLCELAVLDGVIEPPVAEDWYGDTVRFYGLSNEARTLPIEVAGWAGLPSANPVISTGTPTSLAGLNDSGKSFATIADAVEELL